MGARRWRRPLCYNRRVPDGRKIISLGTIRAAVGRPSTAQAREHETSRDEKGDHQSLGLVWIDSPYPVVAAGLKSALEGRARVHVGPSPPADGSPSFAILDAGGIEGLSEALDRLRGVNPDMSILVFSMHVDLPLVRASLRLGVRGFVHAGMDLEQIARATEVAARGEVVAPRKLLAFLAANDDPTELAALTSRQRDILDMVAEGMSNGQIARRLYLSESTVKQHLRAAYKLLGVSNRSDAAKLVKGVY